MTEEEKTVLDKEQRKFCLIELAAYATYDNELEAVAKAQAKATWKAREPEIEQARKAGYKQGVVDANKCGQDDYQAGEQKTKIYFHTQLKYYLDKSDDLRGDLCSLVAALEGEVKAPY